MRLPVTADAPNPVVFLLIIKIGAPRLACFEPV
jgi:hypothetical protein